MIFSSNLKDAKRNAHELLNSANSTDEQHLTSLFGWMQTDANLDINRQVEVTEKLWDDSGLEAHLKRATVTKGGGQYMWYNIKNLTTDIKLLKARQSPVISNGLHASLKELAALENDVLWIFTVPEMSKAWPLNMLFPTAPGLKAINKFGLPLEAFHFFRCYIAPWMNIITPVTTILGPWLYVRKSLGWNVSFTSYIKLLLKAVSSGIRFTGNIKNDVSRLVTMLIYIMLFIYTSVQSFETAFMLQKIRRDLRQKLKNIRKFVRIAEATVASTPGTTFAAWGINKSDIQHVNIPSHISGLYHLFTNQAAQDKLKLLVKAVYALDLCSYVKGLVASGVCVPVQYSAAASVNTTIWNMGHLLLGRDQVRNPISLQKNIIVTGPNAAGKTTYVRALFTNVILSQSLGVACASKAIVRPVSAIGTLIRVSDTLGEASLFEAEARRCADIIQKARNMSQSGLTSLFFMDEPMQSTPPIEGMSTCRAVLEYLAQIPGVRTITTTHYIQVTEIANDLPDDFKNLSMVAMPLSGMAAATAFEFPYKIQAGSSAQCIALELLHENDLPKKVMARAIELKNNMIRV